MERGNYGRRLSQVRSVIKSSWFNLKLSNFCLGFDEGTAKPQVSIVCTFHFEATTKKGI